MKCCRWSVTDEVSHMRCRKWSVADEVSQIKCCRWSVADVVSHMKCRSWSVADEVSQMKCCRWSVADEVSQMKYRRWSIADEVLQMKCRIPTITWRLVMSPLSDVRTFLKRLHASHPDLVNILETLTSFVTFHSPYYVVYIENLLSQNDSSCMSCST